MLKCQKTGCESWAEFEITIYGGGYRKTVAACGAHVVELSAGEPDDAAPSATIEHGTKSGPDWTHIDTLEPER